MQGILITFFLLIFSVVPVLGQLTTDGLSDSDPPDSTGGGEEPVGDAPIDPSPETITDPESEERVENPQAQTEESTENPQARTEGGVTAAPENAAESGDLTNGEPESTRRVLRVANDYTLTADEVLTTLVIIAGDVRIHGSVTGNVLVLGGDVELAPGAQVDGTLQIMGGQVSGDTAGAANLLVSNRWEIVPAAVKLLMQPHTFWKPTTDRETNLRSTLIRSGLFLLMYLLVFALLSRPINAMSGLLARRPIGSILFGVLMLPVIPLIFALLTLSLVGVPFVLLGLALLVPLAVCGKTAIFLTIGSTVFSGRLKPLGIFFCYLLYFMATALPHIDWVTFLLVNAVGIGLCLLSGIRAMFLPGSGRNVGWSPRPERV